MTNPANNSGLVADCEVLLGAAEGWTWYSPNLLNWSADIPMGSWEGVTISGTPGRVTELSFQGGFSSTERLHGRLPGTIGSLTELTYLDLSRNYFTGNIPSELGNLSNLTYLNLADNDLSGSIPSELGNLANLTKLFLYYNSLSGSIPRSIVLPAK